MDMQKYAGESYVKTDDVRDGPRRDKIAGIKMGKWDKPVLVFQGGDLLSLNATNTRTLIKAYGRDSDNWHDHEVELYLGEIEYEGKPQESVLLKPITPRRPTDNVTPMPQRPRNNGGSGSQMDDEIPF